MKERNLTANTKKEEKKTRVSRKQKGTIKKQGVASSVDRCQRLYELKAEKVYWK